MSEVVERLAKVETKMDFYEKRLVKVEESLNDLSHKINEMVVNQNLMLEKFTILSQTIENMQSLLTMKGVKWAIEKLLPPVLAAIMTAVAIKFL